MPRIIYDDNPRSQKSSNKNGISVAVTSLTALSILLLALLLTIMDWTSLKWYKGIMLSISIWYLDLDEEINFHIFKDSGIIAGLSQVWRQEIKGWKLSYSQYQTCISVDSHANRTAEFLSFQILSCCEIGKRGAFWFI